MKLFVLLLSILLCSTAFPQEKLLNQCFVLVLDTDQKTDLREATFDLPFAAMRESADNKKVIVPHYTFDIQSTDTDNATSAHGLNVLSIRPYEYGETLADNEISFFAMEWPEDKRPKNFSSILASFPSINGFEVKTDHLIFDKPIELSEKLVSQLGLSSNMLAAGSYRIELIEVEY